MQINVSTKAIAGALGTVALGVFGWFAVGHIDLRARVTALESSRTEDARQDEELREIRKTMQDMVVLFFAEHTGPLHGVPETFVEEEPPEDVFEYEDAADADEAFSAVQMDLESVLRSRGIEPAKAAPPDR